MDDYKTTFAVKRGLEAVQPILDVVRADGYIAGSYAAFMAAPDPAALVMPGDVDVFATSAEAAGRIAIEISGWRRADGLLKFTCDENSTAWSLSGNGPDLDIQIVKPSPRWQKFPDDILNDFDLDICRAVLVDASTVYADTGIMRMREGKILRINNALRSLKRVIKYAVRGVEFNDHELLKLFRAWEETDAKTKARILTIAEEQAMPSGVDYSNGDDWFEGE